MVFLLKSHYFSIQGENFCVIVISFVLKNVYKGNAIRFWVFQNNLVFCAAWGVLVLTFCF
jgi:hypothetical protein